MCVEYKYDGRKQTFRETPCIFCRQQASETGWLRFCWSHIMFTYNCTCGVKDSQVCFSQHAIHHWRSVRVNASPTLQNSSHWLEVWTVVSQHTWQSRGTDCAAASICGRDRWDALRTIAITDYHYPLFWPALRRCLCKWEVRMASLLIVIVEWRYLKLCFILSQNRQEEIISTGIILHCSAYVLI